MATPRNGIAREEYANIIKVANDLSKLRGEVAETLTAAKRKNKVIDLTEALQLLALTVAVTGQAEMQLRATKSK